jgi:aryl-alcohol dehydrogenase-like predicted oxidoreductase
MSAAVELAMTGKSACRIGFGTGGLLRITSARRRQDVLSAALSSGITHFDTAPLYGFGESERALGRFLRGRRHRVTLTTKFGLQPSPLAARLVLFQTAARRTLELFPSLRRAAVRNSGVLQTPPAFSRAAAMQSLEKSLRALRTDHVNFFLAHQASADSMPDEDLIDWLEAVRKAGKIAAFGVATEFAWLPPVLQQRPRLSRVIQFDSDPARRNVAALAANNPLVITYGFLGRAVITCRERGPEWVSRAGDELGGMLLRAAALANPNGIVLMQSRSTRRIETNVRAATSAHDDERVRELVQLLESI